ncbi:MAG: imidazolonepropionase-like amidohydrolase [Rhodothermales bacterium]|jgi:imidazolonepropionase-like amidohydrolase
MKQTTILAAFALALGITGLAGPATAQTIAITNAEIHTVSGAVITGGTIVIKDGLISAVGASARIPSGTRTIDGTGKIITPGFMDSGSQVGLREIGSSAAGTVDGSTSEADFGASFNPVWAVNPANTHIPITRLRGVTSSVLVPGGSQLFTGQAAVIALDGESVSDMIRSESVGVITAMGEAGSGRAGGSRAANYQRLHDALWDARAKMLTPEDEEDKDKDDKDDKGDDDDDNEEKDPRAKGGRSSLNDRNIEALQAVMSGAVPLVVTANRVSDLQLALRLKEEFGVRMVISGGAEAWKVAAELAAARVPVIVRATTDLPTFDGLSATLKNAGLLQGAGVEVLLGGGRAISHNAGLAVANGMDHAAALRAATLGPATVWGLGESMGSLDVGKVADLVVWSGDPFELSSSAEHVFIGGREIPEDSRQERLFDRYRDLGRYRTIRK